MLRSFCSLIEKMSTERDEESKLSNGFDGGSVIAEAAKQLKENFTKVMMQFVQALKAESLRRTKGILFTFYRFSF